MSPSVLWEGHETRLFHGTTVFGSVGNNIGRGGGHSIKSLWIEHQEDMGWGVMLVDTWNYFNEINRKGML